jgi:hypothetical protein
LSRSSTPAAIRIDSALSTSAKFGTIGQSSSFFVLGRKPIREVANGAVMAADSPSACALFTIFGAFPGGRMCPVKAPSVFFQASLV